MEITFGPERSDEPKAPVETEHITLTLIVNPADSTDNGSNDFMNYIRAAFDFRHWVHAIRARKARAVQ